MPSAVSSGTPSAVKSYFSPSCASSGTSPAALRPNRKSSPTTTATACSRSHSTIRTNSSGLSWENSTLKGSTNTASAPIPASSSACRLGVVRNGGCDPGRMTSSGCGSKVITTSGRSFSRATCLARATTRWWPRCTPSNTPIVTTHPAQSSGTSSKPYHRYTIPVPPLSRPWLLGPGCGAASTSLASGEDHQRARLAGLFGQQGDQGAVGGEGGRRARGAGAGRAGRQAAAVRQPTGLVRGQLPAAERGRGGLRQRQDLEPLGQLVQGFRGIEAVLPDPGAAQRGQVPAGAELVTEVTGQGPDVRAAGAAHGGVHVGEVTAGYRADTGDGELVDGDRAGFELGRGPGAGQLVGALAVDLDRADRGRDLLDLAGQRLDGLVDRLLGDGFGRRGGGELAFGIVGAGGLAEPDRGVVLLLRQGQVAEHAGGLLHPDDQDAGRHRVQGARVALPPGPGPPPDPGHHVMRGHAAGLVDDDQAILAVGHSSSSASAGLRYGSGSPAGTAPSRLRASSASALRAWATSSSIRCALSGRASATKASDGVCRRPSCRPTSDRMTPVALARAMAVSVRSASVPSTV